MRLSDVLSEFSSRHIRARTEHQIRWQFSKRHEKKGNAIQKTAGSQPENESCNLTLQAGPHCLVMPSAKSEPPKFAHCVFVQQTSNPSYRVVAGLNWKAQCLQCFETLP
jgi:hypothetical protein